jgi:protein-disulfide isomerase
VINAVIFITLAGAAIVKKQNPLRWVAVDARGILPSPRALSGFAVLAAAAVALVVFYPRLYIDDINCNVTTPLPNNGGGTCNEEATYGPADAPVVITEFSDYQCPYCAMTHFTLRKAVDMFEGKVMLKHRHFPLDQSCNPLLTRPFHKNACLAARAAVCAGKQSRFWEYNDLLWKNQKKLNRESVIDLAGSLGLDVGAFTSCLGDKATLELIRRDIEEATNTPFVQSGMVGTPIIYVGDSPHIGGISLSELEKMINQQLAREAEKAAGQP